MEWFFSDLGTTIIGLIIGIISGGIVGYRIGIKKSNRQVQKSRDHVTQIQIGEGDYNDK